MRGQAQSIPRPEERGASVSKDESPSVASWFARRCEASSGDAAARLLTMRVRESPLRERLLDHELRRLAVIAFDKPLAVQQRTRVRHQRRAAADHDAVMGGIERGQPDIGEQFARVDQVGDAAAVAEGIAGHGRVIDQLVANVFADQFVVRQLFR